MAIRLRCKCGEPLKANDGLAGKKAKCPKCGEVVLVPSQSGPEKTRYEIKTGTEINRQLVDLHLVDESAYDLGAVAARLTFDPEFKDWIKYKGTVTCHGCGKPIIFQSIALIQGGSCSGGQETCTNCENYLSHSASNEELDGTSHLFLYFVPVGSKRGQVLRPVQVSINEVQLDTPIRSQKPHLNLENDEKAGIDGQIAKWRNQLESPDNQAREIAVCKLAESTHPARIEGLIAALGNSTWQVAATAARALGESGNKTAIEPLLAVLKRYPSRTSAVRMAAIDALKNLGHMTENRDEERNQNAVSVVEKGVDANSLKKSRTTTPEIGCSRCGRRLEELGGVWTPPGGGLHRCHQWRGNCCPNCQMVFCPSCVPVGGPTPCPYCASPTPAAQWHYLQQFKDLPAPRKWWHFWKYVRL